MASPMPCGMSVAYLPHPEWHQASSRAHSQLAPSGGRLEMLPWAPLPWAPEGSLSEQYLSSNGSKEMRKALDM